MQIRVLKNGKRQKGGRPQTGQTKKEKRGPWWGEPKPKKADKGGEQQQRQEMGMMEKDEQSWTAILNIRADGSKKSDTWWTKAILQMMDFFFFFIAVGI